MSISLDDPSIPGWFNFSSVYDRMVQRSADGAAFVEVGAWFGRSTSYLAKAIRASEKKIGLHVVDTWKGSPNEAAHREEVAKHGGDLFPAFRAHMARNGVMDLITPVQKPSVDAAGDFADGSLDFVYIDAAHDPVSVSADIRAWWPKVKPGGFLGGHDYGKFPGVTGAVDGLFGPVTVVAEADTWLVEKTADRRGPATGVVLVPVGGSVEPGCEDGLKALERRGWAVWRVRGYSAIDAARNPMATDALAQGFDELMWVDSDVVFSPDDVERLRSHQLPFVCGIYPKKSRREFAAAFPPGAPSVQFGRGGGLTEIRYCGFGFNHTRRAVYDAIQEKLALPVCNRRFGSPLVPYFAPLVAADGSGPWYLGEDYAFCERARLAGVKVMADTTIRLWHVGGYRYGWEDARADKERFGDYTFHMPAPAGPPASISSAGQFKQR